MPSVADCGKSINFEVRVLSGIDGTMSVEEDTCLYTRKKGGIKLALEKINKRNMQMYSTALIQGAEPMSINLYVRTRPSSLALGLCLRLFIVVFLSVSSVNVSRLLAGLGVVPLLLLLLLGLPGREVAIS
ncbi:hypothetical protein HBI38_228960 [Parastagonospora nodorum]|nr:hypothetical protein HBI41_241680 [Parastagonospora nodorum]KAH6263207.1 hypothetical protein HBI40_235800 [Parastagonospora nodorum]KAH6299373.1 hypothetical protein HBI38_228960 [Parastagonospora nodorum]